MVFWKKKSIGTKEIQRNLIFMVYFLYFIQNGAMTSYKRESNNLYEFRAWNITMKQRDGGAQNLDFKFIVPFLYFILPLYVKYNKNLF